ncbi:MAG: DUF4143 domain-containing protein, partial [Anaerolineae bacterium]|nr:DUF4143 domain-containing protein [Anaerolineae bacterium]
LLAHFHGQTWIATEASRSFGVSNMTVGRYLDILEGVFMIRVLRPWYANIHKRQIKSPKIYFRDSGLLHTMLGINSELDLYTHPKIGASWEGYAIEETIKRLRPDEVYFWGTHNGAELDMLLLRNGQRIGVECKRKDAPYLTPSMKIAMEDLQLDKLIVVYPGEKKYPLADQIEVVPLIYFGDTANPSAL